MAIVPGMASDDILSEDLQCFRKSVIKDYGKDVFLQAKDLLLKDQTIVGLSPSMDVGLSGGIPFGSFVTIAGPPKAGKTTTTLQLAAEVQKLGKRVFYIDVENRLKKMNLNGIDGLKPDNIFVIKSSEYKILSGEDYLNITMNIMKEKENRGSMIIIDSLSSLCPEGELAGEVSGSIRSTTPKLVASFCRQAAGIIPVMDNIVVGMQHLITNTSGYGAKWHIDTGEKVKYQADIRLIIKGTPERWMEDDKQIGQIITWEVAASALGPPGRDIKSYLRYGMGLDKVKEICAMAVDLGIVDKAGAWFSFDYNDQNLKFQGEKKLYDAIKGSEDYFNFINSEVKKALS